MRSKCSVKFLVQLIFFLLLNNKRLCKLFWEHLIWLRKFFNNSNLWFPLCRLRVYDSKEYKEHIHSPNLRNESVFCWSWFLLSRGLHVYMLTPPSAFSLKKEKRKKTKIGFVFLFSLKNYCQNCIFSWFTHIRMKRIITISKHTFVRIFSLCISFLASNDYDLFSHSQCISLKTFGYNKPKCDCDTAALQNSNIDKIMIAA